MQWGYARGDIAGSESAAVSTQHCPGEIQEGRRILHEDPVAGIALEVLQERSIALIRQPASRCV